jgi:hypothetical protein
MSRARLLLAAVLAVIVISAAAVNGSTAGLSNEPAGSSNAVSSGKATFTAGSATVACNLTLSLHWLRGPIAKVEGTTMGYVTAVIWANCEGGGIREVLGLPWDILYSSINGTLPSGVTSLNLVIDNAQWKFSGLGGFAECLYAGDMGLAMAVSLVRGTTDRYTSGVLTLDASSRLRLVSGFACPPEGSWRGRFTLSPTLTLTRT